MPVHHPECLFVSDLHGKEDRYEKLWRAIAEDRPAAVFLGGDLFPFALGGYAATGPEYADFVNDYLAPGFGRVRDHLLDAYPAVFLILGNDDPRNEERGILQAGSGSLWTYLHDRRGDLGRHPVYGYACVPPTPFRWKDWERYDVSRYVPPGCVSPERGTRTVEVSKHEIRYGTIRSDLEALTGAEPMQDAILLFHTPPHESALDRVANDGKMVDHVPLDLHVGSIAVRRFIEERQPLLTLHGHIHESARLTSSWRDRIGRTHLFGAAHDGPELALVRFRTDDLENARRDLL